MMKTRQASIDAIVDGLLADAKDDYVGLWQIVNRVSKHDNAFGEDDIRRQTLRVLRALLKYGLVVGDLTADGDFKQWPAEEAEAVISKVDMKWNELGRTPDIGDICWLRALHS